MPEIVWDCYRCHATAGRYKSSALCRTCYAAILAAGGKWCATCRRALPASAFGRYYYACTDCHAAASRARRLSGAPWYEASKARERERYATDPAYRAQRRAYDEANRAARNLKRQHRRRQG